MSNQTEEETKKFRGIIHIHTTCSYDGTCSIPDFADLAKKKHYNFIALTEHAEDFNDKKMHTLVHECKRASCEDFLVLPGLEFNCNGMHILGIGIEKYINSINPDELIQKIHENNGLAILAHTAYYKDIPYEKLKTLDIIEIWNPRYGETLSPSIKSIKIFRKFRTMKKSYGAAGGLDFHKTQDFVSLYLVVSSDRLTQKNILESLKRGDFSTRNRFIELSSRIDHSILLTGIIYLLACIQFIPDISKKILRKIYKMCR
jgi:predicted metal-dependent phosphoesterase TrpH